jgi:hypothetical protein
MYDQDSPLKPLYISMDETEKEVEKEKPIH